MSDNRIEYERYHLEQAVAGLHKVARHFELINRHVPVMEIDMIIKKRDNDLKDFVEANYPLVTKGNLK